MEVFMEFSDNFMCIDHFISYHMTSHLKHKT